MNTVFVIAAVSAAKQWIIITVDVTAAFLNAPMIDEVFMRLDAQISKLMCELDDSYLDYIDENGEITVILLKALYGCCQSSALWYQCLKDAILDFGCQICPTDQCVFVFNRGMDSLIISVYVDDIFIAGSNQHIIDLFNNHLQRKFRNITVNTGQKQSYLGILFDFSVVGQVILSMESYIDILLRENSIHGKATSPATSSILKAQGGEEISFKQKEKLRSDTAKLLYIATRVRQDILFAVNHLCTRVNVYNASDVQKFYRIMEYLNYTRDHKLTLRATSINPVPIIVYADASFASHEDGKSHSGLSISLGNGSVLAKSTKQRIVTKSSTESELVCASDCIPIVYYIRDLINFCGFSTQITLMQDNQSTMKMIQNGTSTALRTKHINVKYFHLKEIIENGEIKLQYLQTQLMIADLLTKPIQGNLFNRLKDALLNRAENANE